MKYEKLAQETVDRLKEKSLPLLDFRDNLSRLAWLKEEEHDKFEVSKEDMEMLLRIQGDFKWGVEKVFTQKERKLV